MVAATISAGWDPALSAEQLYLELQDVSVTLGMANIWKIWQYLPNITGPSNLENRYQRYCWGRRKAIAQVGWKDTELPAACLLGDQTNEILLYALMGRSPGVAIENPRQVSAFRYPQRYSQATPAFSRAVAVKTNGSESLYVSGTSSIFGHSSLHTSALDQLAETFENLRSLLNASSKFCTHAAEGLRALRPLKIYIRNPVDFPQIQRWVEHQLPVGHPVIYLKGSICRDELLVEAEGEITP